jgi:hypothetical protein
MAPLLQRPKCPLLKALESIEEGVVAWWSSWTENLLALTGVNDDVEQRNEWLQCRVGWTRHLLDDSSTIGSNPLMDVLDAVLLHAEREDVDAPFATACGEARRLSGATGQKRNKEHDVSRHREANIKHRTKWQSDFVTCSLR